MTYAFFLINHFYSATSKLVLRGGGPKLGPLTGICLVGGVKCQIGGVVVHDYMIYAKSTLGEPRLVHCSAEWQDGSIKVKDDTTENGCVLVYSHEE